MLAEILQSIRNDLGYAIRLMRNNPLFSLTAVVTMGLAIGANAAMFAVVQAVLFQPLPYPDSKHLVRLAGGATPTRFSEMTAAGHSFLEVGAYTYQENVTLSGISEPEILKGVHITADFLHILEVHSLLGRGFRPEENSPGSPPVAMISAELWKRVFAADPNIIGKTAILDTRACTIVGVLPPRFQFPYPGIDVWMPAPSDLPSIDPKSRALSPFLTLFGRLDPGTSMQQANARLRIIRHQYAAAHPGMLDAKPKSPEELTPMKEDLVGEIRSMLWLLFGAVTFVLLIACANIATLLLTRANIREREFALRSAIGAARGRLVRQMLTESVLLSVLGGFAGLLITIICLHAVPRLTGIELPRAQEVGMSWIVFAFAAALSTLCGLVLGLAPSLHASRLDQVTALRSAGQAITSTTQARTTRFWNLRSALSIIQVALSTVLLIGAMLLIESVAHMRSVPLGFNSTNLLTASINLPPLRYNTNQKIASFFKTLTEQLRSLPGVHGATAAMSLPLMNYPGIPIQDAAKPRLKLNERPIAKYFPVLPGYFQTLQISLMSGREFNEHDTVGAKRVAIINETLARRLWPAYPKGQDPIGQRLFVGAVNPNPAEIIGIAKDVKQNLGEQEIWPDSVYVSFLQSPIPFAVLAVRTEGAPLSLIQPIRKQVFRLDHDQAVATPETMDALVEAQIGNRRLLLNVLTAFAGTAMLLAVLGLYGVVAYAVNQRVQEIGIRRALGAQEGDIVRLVLAQGAGSAVLGISLGIFGAFMLTRLMRAELFTVSPTDPTTFLFVALTFLCVSLLASYIPARRATKIDPAVALRV